MGRKKQEVDMSKWLINAINYDIIVIGAQECKISFKKKMIENITNYVAKIWGENPVMESISMWEMFLMILIKPIYKPVISCM